ncbi:hypothetical protein RhiirA5_69801 [Rhizophagus irregularis]|uniref:Uncharacterized protein n=1 Tax=Rhizophagus irregularis TaxID=588596 RepID=A0A2N0Q2X6_9GLOM|nr:hypothetical protein RhiirA5_69801 [Rhizophagus irregularis]GET53467.1 hypothetical protein RIR_jg23144.t1 [Rhizophagus irregularis DAOM 181602=DAOM 197198]
MRSNCCCRVITFTRYANGENGTRGARILSVAYFISIYHTYYQRKSGSLFYIYIYITYVFSKLIDVLCKFGSRFPTFFLKNIFKTM